MARIEKTVFISYRRKDISWALAVYQYLMSQKYDVFFDYTHIPSGDFEQIILSNIRARAHFVLILTPTTLDRCSDPNDWVRREIEAAIDENRNIIPLFFDGFNFGATSVTEKLTGKLADVKRYNGLEVPSGYFPEAMDRLRTRYLNVPLSAVIHPVSTKVKKVVKEEKSAANKALVEQKQEIKELVKPAKEKSEKPEQPPISPSLDGNRVPDRGEGRSEAKPINFRPYAIGVGVLLLVVLGFLGIRALMNNSNANKTPEPTQTREETLIPTLQPTLISTKPIPTSTVKAEPSTTANPKFGIGSTMTLKDGMILLYVPAGEFTMGSEDGNADEKPVHTVYLDAFWIDQAEVTNAMYAMCVEAGACNEPRSKSSGTRDNYYGKSEFDNYPVVFVSWKDAYTYCRWASRRLPTEAEWEKAARGENAFTYPWGNDRPNNNLLNYNKSVGDTAEVGKYPNGASPYGAYDMAGNVWEWVNDWYDAYPGNTVSSPGYGIIYRVLRGGSWSNDDINIRSANRYFGLASVSGSNGNFGFRCAMDAE